MRTLLPPRLSAAYAKTLPVRISRKRVNTFFTFYFDFLFMIPQSTEMIWLGLTTLSAVDGDHDSGELFVDDTRFVTSV